METSVVVDGKKLFLNPFMSNLIGNILTATVRSLKSPEGERVEFNLRGDDLQLTIDEKEVPLNLGQARQIVGNVLKGVAASLKGAENAREIQFSTKLTQS